MSENSTEESSKLQDNSPNHRVDGAILDARSRLSLLKDQLVNLTYEVSRTSELDVERNRNSTTSPTAFNNRTNIADAESSSEVQDNFQSTVDLHEGSSSSSRSWSVGRSTGFGPNGVDLILQKDASRTGSLPQLNQRGMESPFRSESYSQGQGFNPTKKQIGNSTEGWILNSMFPFSCWPREEETVDFRWTVMKNQNQQSLKARTLTKQGSKVSKISLAVRSAIGKIWEEVNQEISQEILNLVQSFFSIEDRGKIDPLSCWISGRALTAISDGLPFALTVHTYTSIGKPCISGHANVTVEVTSMDLENAEAVEKALQDFEQRAYGVSSKSSFSMPEHPSTTDHYKTPSRSQILSSDFDAVPPLFPIREQGEEVGIRRRSKSRRKSEMKDLQPMMKEAGSESLSTFSFNSVEQNKRDQDNPTSGSSDTFSTADLTAFIRHGGQRQNPVNSTGADLESAGKNRTVNRQRTVFSELDLVWEMHYPDCAKMETVIASRKYQQDEETSHQSHRDVTSRSTYIGDTDSDSSFDIESAPSSSREVILHQDPFTYESQDQTISRQRPVDQWDEVVDSRRRHQDLTESMEVNLDDERDRSRRWGRIQKLSSFVRRVKKMIGTSSSSEGKRPRKSSQNDAIQESTNQEPTLQFYSPEPSTPSERHLSTSPTGQRSTEGYYSAPSTESEYQNLDSSLGGQQPASPGHAVSTPSTRKSLESPTGDQGLFLTGGHVGSFGSSVGQNVSWDESRSVKLPVKDLGNGQYLALGHLRGPGRYQISVKIGNKKISEEPFLTTVADANSLGSGISSDGPFFQRPDSTTTVSASSTVPIPHPNFPPCHSIAYDPDRLEYALRHPHLGFVDLLLIVDCTSSMGLELQQLPLVVQGIEDLIKDSVLLKRLRMGVIAYRDHDPEDDDTFLLRTQDLTEDVEKVKRFLNSLEAEGGGDYPEAMEVAFAEAVEGVQWSLFSSRFVLWIGDAPPHGYQGFTRKQALDEEEKFKEAKTRLKKAAREVELAMKNNESPRQMNVHDRELADALSTCDAIAKYHDKYPLGIPGGVRWEETIERLSSLGVRTLVMGLRDSVSHEASRNCLRTIAHISGGALLEIVALDSSVIAPLIVAIVEQSLDQQLIEEEVCDLILCLKNDFEQQSLEDKKRSLVESMSQAAKQPYRLRVAPKGGFSESPGSSRMDHGFNELDHRFSRPDSRVSNVPSSSRGSCGSLGPLTISGGSFDLHSSSSMMDSKALLLGMVSIRFDEAVLEQVLKNLRIKAEVVSHCLLSNFESLEQWVDFHLCQVSSSETSGLYKGQRRKISGLTTPLSIRYILALQTMAQQRN